MQPSNNIDIFVDISRVREMARAAERLLILLRSEYDLSRWEYTKKVRIAPYEIPHSHPILTLNSCYAIGSELDEDSFLSTYLHEQMHWVLDDFLVRETEKAIDIFKERYPKFHEGLPTTAKDEYSTYLHFIVNGLELAAMTELVGRVRARKVLERYGHYTKIYKTVLRDFDTIKAVLAETGILPLPIPQ